MLWLRLSVPVRRRVAPAAATEVRLVVIATCPTRVGVAFPTYGYALKQSTAVFQYQAHPVKSWFHFAQRYGENDINQLFGPWYM